MFTGIVEETGTIKHLQSKKNLSTLRVAASKVLKGTKVGESIAVDGVCLTVTTRNNGTLNFDLMNETLKATTLGTLKPKSKVNLERAMRAQDRLGGHFVLGHIDGVGTIQKIVKRKNYVEYQIKMKKDLLKYIVPKGSICIDGISLTVGEVQKNNFTVYFIPHTLKVTTIGAKKINDHVNVETDILAKYIISNQ